MKQREGYLMVDHRASPGLSEEDARRLGYDPRFCREGKLYEQATLGCCHCKNTVVKNPLRTRERHKCMKCSGKYLCDFCHMLSCLPDYDHTPFEKKVDLILSGSSLFNPLLHAGELHGYSSRPEPQELAARASDQGGEAAHPERQDSGSGSGTS